jgi:hypothetical protein
MLYAHSGGLLLFDSIFTPIAHLQSNKFEQRGLRMVAIDLLSIRTSTSGLPFVLLKTNLT